jgi:hypothetical protein
MVVSLLMCLGFHQDFQKEGKTRKKDKAESPHAQLG